LVYDGAIHPAAIRPFLRPLGPKGHIGRQISV
jgi:hypothetical protein